ncbi:hypothetical protein OV203_26130 [Nannocystis sp. ILAH1]|uniref:hypothetical protein n=1 Tax=Nannocystis sp. ILAH1 TaxID=2996789 RepID=UPI002271524E|nr:hypothetical protein [Nannocystis sp. ILAH1]MCY0990649.1 hypothetical protein [Nannocystis sp. ILAH1]
MQVHKLDEKAKNLQQGSIFKIQGLTFAQKEGKALSLEDFYPHIGLEGVQYGIVVSQSCDLVWDEAAAGAAKDRPAKVPYISIGFLEPFSKYVQKAGVEWDKAKVSWMGPDDEGEGDETEYTFVSAHRLSTILARSMRDLLQNNEKCYFFISFPENPLIEKYFVLNLTKLVPIRVSHYPALRDRVTHQLTTEFENKLGWKLAELYGRVGTKDYETDELAGIIEDLQDITAPVMMGELTRAIKVEDEPLFSKALSLAKKTKKNGPARNELFLQIVRSRSRVKDIPAQVDAPSSPGEAVDGSPIMYVVEPTIQGASLISADQLSDRGEETTSLDAPRPENPCPAGSETREKEDVV